MSVNFLPKMPAEVLDYQVNWMSRLNGDAIQSSEWSSDTGLTISSVSHAAVTTTIWLAGGTAGTSYKLINEILTVGGRTMIQTVNLLVVANR